MSPGHTPRTPADLRLAIERELQQRLGAESPAAARLQCVACQHVNPIDARFCTQCGARFNAVVVTGGPGASTVKG